MKVLRFFSNYKVTTGKPFVGLEHRSQSNDTFVCLWRRVDCVINMSKTYVSKIKKKHKMERFIHGEGIINFTQTWCKEKIFYGQLKRKLSKLKKIELLQKLGRKSVPSFSAFRFFTFSQD